MTEPEGDGDDGLDRLEAEFGPAGWTFGTNWVTAGSGPDALLLVAWRDGPPVTSYTVSGLRDAIVEAGG